ncbi:MAG: phosphoserine transaminase [Alphaproteobacteria bacterium]
MKPTQRPECPAFSTGPCAKRPGWSVAVLERAAVGRSHRSDVARAKLAQVIDESRRLQGLPDDYLLGIVPASDTGAVEMALWSLLGARGVDVLAWESFGKNWAGDVQSELGLEDVRLFEAEYGALPELSAVSGDRDIVFVWNGTTSGVRVPDGEWIPADRSGLAICDATSAVYAMELPWSRLDVVTYSWQKVLGGEGAHGMLILSPRAVQRLESYRPPRGLPKIFRLTKDGALIAGIFRGQTINTPSLLCVEDALDSLRWAREIGGLPALIARSQANLEAISAWVEATSWVEFVATDPATRSSTSICLKVVDPWFASLAAADQAACAKQVVTLLEAEGAAHDIGSYPAAPPGFRVWGGATVERADIEALLPWLDWGYGEVKSTFAEAS